MGHIYVADGSHDWAHHYAFPPTPYSLNDEVLRLYVGFCDECTVARVGYVDVLKDNPGEVVAVSQNPVLDIGIPGTFDDNGVLPTSLLSVGNELYLYYVGYQLGRKLNYYQFQGLAISSDGGNTFNRAKRVPIIDRSDKELFNRTSAFVMRETTVYKMWYVAGSEWIYVNGKPLPKYNLRYVESKDGVSWPEEGVVCLDFANVDSMSHPGSCLGHPIARCSSKMATLHPFAAAVKPA